MHLRIPYSHIPSHSFSSSFRGPSLAAPLAMLLQPVRRCTLLCAPSAARAQAASVRCPPASRRAAAAPSNLAARIASSPGVFGRARRLKLPATAAAGATPGSTSVKHTIGTTTQSFFAPPETTFTWTLEKLTLADFTGAKPDDLWRSPEFLACGVRWQLNVRPATAFSECGGRPACNAVGVFLELLEPDCTLQPAVADLTYSFYSASGSLLPVTFSTKKPSPPDGGTIPQVFDCTGYPFAVSHEQLTANIQKFLKDGKLTVMVTLRARSFAETQPAPPPPLSIGADMAALLASCDGADVTFTFAADAEAEPVQAHSLILAARSATLRQQLRGPLASAPPHVSTVPDGIAPHTFKRLLSFLYTDELTPQNHEEALQLLTAAEHYGVPRLRAITECVLQNGLTPQNVITTLSMAHRGSFHDLRAAALRFVVARMHDVMATPQWSELRAEQPALIEAVLHTVAHGEPPAPVKLQ
jgi:hypothetical protein